jgi:hypothetical protein
MERMAASERGTREAREAVTGFAALTVTAVVAAMLGWSQAAIWIAGIVALCLGILLWIVVIERRLPWPFGPRVPGSTSSSWPMYIGLVLAVTLSTFTPWPYNVYVSPSTGLGVPAPGLEGQVNLLYVPSNAAATLIAAIGILTAAPVIGEFLIAALRQRALPATR